MPRSLTSVTALASCLVLKDIPAESMCLLLEEGRVKKSSAINKKPSWQTMWYGTRGAKTRIWLMWRKALGLNMSDVICCILHGFAVLLHACLNKSWNCHSCNATLSRDVNLTQARQYAVSVRWTYLASDRAQCDWFYVAKVGCREKALNIFALRTIELHFPSNSRVHSGLPMTLCLCHRKAQKQAYHHHVLHNVNVQETEMQCKALL